MLDKLTYSGNPANLEGTGSSTLSGGHLRRRRGRRGCRGLGRDRQLRRRDARRPLDPRRDRLRPDGVLRDAGPARGGASQTVPATSRCRRTRSTVTSPAAAHRWRPTRSSRRARTASSRRPVTSTSRVCENVRRQRLDHSRLEHLRAEPVSGEDDPADDDQRHRGKPLPVYGDGKQVRDWLWARTTAPGSRPCCARGLRVRSTTSAAATSSRTWRSSAASSAHRRRRVADPSRRGPRRPRPSLFARHEQAARARLVSR